MGIIHFFKSLEDKIETFVDSSLGTDRPAPIPPEAGTVRPVEPSAGRKLPEARAEEQSAPVGPSPISREPLEVRKALVSMVEASIRTVDGQPSFPFNRIDVDLIPASDSQKAFLYTELEEADRLRRDLQRMFRAARVTPEPNFSVYVHYFSPDKVRSPHTFSDGFRVECSRELATVKMPRRSESRMRLRVEVGDATPTELPLVGEILNLGRLPEARDSQGRILRRNQLAFQDEGPVNQSVSRLHAHLALEGTEWRLYDDRSTEGTVIMRGGRSIQVPSGGRRGVVIEAGDEIWLGSARLLVEKT